MARPPSLKPSYCRDKTTERAYVVIDGKRHWLGPRGSYGTQESRDKYDRLIGEWIARGRAPDVSAGAAPAATLTVSDVCLAFWEHALRTYPAAPFAAGKRPEGELGNFWDALRPLRRLYGTTPAAEFGPVKLSAVRDDMIKLGWCRNTINRNVARLRHVFKWAAAAELLPGEVWHRLAALEGLRKGRSAARETAKVRPVPDAQVDAVLPLLSPQVVAMIELQRLTGARSGELCRMRTCDVDTSDKRLWVYRPSLHKTAHRDHVREIFLGPRAKAVLEPFLKPDLQAYVFSPAEAAEWHRERRRRGRATPLTPSQAERSDHARRSAHQRKRRPGARYSKGTYAEAIERACDVAFPPPAELARGRVKTPRGEKQTRVETAAEWRKRLGPETWAELLAWRKRHRWHPHRLRHSFATRVRKEFGRDVVGALLGDKSPAMVDVYAERDAEAARRVVAQIG